MMVMRVLPGEGTTAPRLSRLKSYSLRMLVLRLARTCFARGNDPDPIAARGVNNNTNSTNSIHAQRHQERLTFRAREIRSASCRARVRQSVYTAEVAVTSKKTQNITQT